MLVQAKPTTTKKATKASAVKAKSKKRVVHVAPVEIRPNVVLQKKPFIDLSKYNQATFTDNSETIEAVEKFFSWYGGETQTVYSTAILKAMKSVFRDEFDNPHSTPEEIEDLMSELQEINKLILSLRRPVLVADN